MLLSIPFHAFAVLLSLCTAISGTAVGERSSDKKPASTLVLDLSGPTPTSVSKSAEKLPNFTGIVEIVPAKKPNTRFGGVSGAIALTAGALAVVVVLVVIACWCVRRKRLAMVREANERGIVMADPKMDEEPELDVEVVEIREAEVVDMSRIMSRGTSLITKDGFVVRESWI